MEIELRSLPFNVVAQDEGDRLTVSGIVNRVGSVSEVITNRRTGKKFRETIEPGVFSRAIDRAKRVDFLSMHDKNQVLSTTDNDSLELRETDEGLSMNAQISGTSWGQDTYRLINDGIIKGMSFGMRVLNQDWSRGADGLPLRTIKDIDLFEISAVRNPAYKASSIEARDTDSIIDVEIPDDIEERDNMSEEEKKAQAAAKAAKEAEEAKKSDGSEEDDDKKSSEGDKKSDKKQPEGDKKSDSDEGEKKDAKKDENKDEKRSADEVDYAAEIRSLNEHIAGQDAQLSELVAQVAELRSLQEDHKDAEEADVKDEHKDEEEHRSVDKDIDDMKTWFSNQK